MLGSKRPGPFPLHVGVGASQLAGRQRGGGNGAAPNSVELRERINESCQDGFLLDFV